MPKGEVRWGKEAGERTVVSEGGRGRAKTNIVLIHSGVDRCKTEKLGRSNTKKKVGGRIPKESAKS